MRTVETVQDMKALVGQELGVSDWVLIDQKRIDQFTECTLDDAWVHTDAERAARELPAGVPIAHGWLTLALVTKLMSTIWQVKHKSKGLNLGANRVRFPVQVPAGSRLRLRQTLKSAEDVKDGGVRLTYESVMEMEGSDRPACVAENVNIIYP